jgi:Zn-dependent protease with chaperone function
VRFLFPLALLVGVAVLLTTSVAALLVALVVPVVLLLAGVGAIASLRGVGLGLQLMRGGFALLGRAFEFLGDVFALIFMRPEVEKDLADSEFPPLVERMPPAAFPEFHRLQREVAAAVGVKPIDELWVSPDAALGIGTAKSGGRRIRYLVVGLGLVHCLTPAQLRAALAHEFGHERGGDLWLGRWARHLVQQLVFAAERFSPINPAWWSAMLSLFIVKLGYLPWSRAKEYAADRWSARLAGGATSAAALRSVRETAPALHLSLMLVLDRVKQTRRSPARLAEAARLVMDSVSPASRHRLAVAAEGDPLDLGGRTHPPIALRIAALTSAPSVAAEVPPPIDAARLGALDEQLTRRWLAEVGGFLPVEAFLSSAPSRTEAPAPRASAVGGELDIGGEPVPLPVATAAVESDPDAAEGALELDVDGDWWKRRQR